MKLVMVVCRSVDVERQGISKDEEDIYLATISGTDIFVCACIGAVCSSLAQTKMSVPLKAYQHLLSPHAKLFRQFLNIHVP
ncbi:MAG: hypothetical protein MUF71_16425 [Candidatus Kapabacteria bacterium]|nr:hypothetical protein [Candidatus Kapabacteria bacterium]